MKIAFIICTLLFSACTGSFAQRQNPFDIQRSGAEVLASPVQVQEVEDKPVAEEINPFSVSHIPIRKNQFREIEDLAKVKKDDATISLSYLPLWMIVISMCMLAFMLFTKQDHIVVLLKSLANENMMKLSNYEEKGGWNFIYVMGYGIFLLNAALILYLLAIRQFALSIDHLYWWILGACALFFLGKHLVNSLFSWITRLEKESKLYDFTMITIYNLVGIFFLILSVIMVFGPAGWFKALAIAAMVVFVIGLLSRYYKAIRVGQFQLNNHFMHFFLYFCAFEFSPWVILYTALTDVF